MRFVVVAALVCVAPGCSLLSRTVGETQHGSSSEGGQSTEPTASTAPQAAAAPELEPDDGIGGPFHQAHVGEIVFADGPLATDAGEATETFSTLRLGTDAHPTMFLAHSLHNAALAAGLDVGFGSRDNVAILVSVDGQPPLTVRQSFTTLVFGRSTVVALSIPGIGGRGPLVWPNVNPGELELLDALRALPDGEHRVALRVLVETRPPPGPQQNGIINAPWTPQPPVVVGEAAVTLVVDAEGRRDLQRTSGPFVVEDAFANAAELGAIRRAAQRAYGRDLVELRGYFDAWNVERDAVGQPVRREALLTLITRAGDACQVRGVRAVAEYAGGGRFGAPELAEVTDPRLAPHTIPCEAARARPPATP